MFQSEESFMLKFKRKFKNISVIILICLMIFSNLNLVNAEPKYEYYADKLSQIEVFVGTGDGFDLEREPTRLEGLIMLIRLLGVEKEAEEITEFNYPFDDVPEWGKYYVQYAYDNNLTNGVGEDKFGSNQLMNAKSFTTFLLRALNYSDKEGDFSWSNANDFAKEIGLLSENLYFEITSKTFLRDHVAKMSYDALDTKLKNSDINLVEYLVENGSIDVQKAEIMLNEEEVKEEIQNDESESKEINFDNLIDSCVYIEIKQGEFLGSGSGFFINNSGRIITNYHVIEGAKGISIVDSNGNTFEENITIVGYDKNRDIAILDINHNNKNWLEISDSEVKIGQKVYAIGSPLGLQNTVSEGIISGVREIDIQTTAPISHGSSGGALINDNGEVVGITYAGYTEGENLGLVIPIDEIYEIDDTLELSIDEFINKEVEDLEITLNATSDDELIYLQWNDVGADYYHVYLSVNNGEFFKLENLDDGGYAFSHYEGQHSITVGDCYEDEICDFFVVSLVNGEEKSWSNVEGIRGPLEVAYSDEEYENIIENDFGIIQLDGYDLYVEDAYIYNVNDYRKAVNLYIYPSDLTNYLDAEWYNKDELLDYLSSYASIFSEDLDSDIFLQVVYSTILYEYPSEFEENAILNESNMSPIEYSDDGNWFVYFPLVYVEIERNATTYNYNFWYNY